MSACPHTNVRVAPDFASACCPCGAVWMPATGWTRPAAPAPDVAASKLSQPCGGGACVAGCTACQREREVRT